MSLIWVPLRPEMFELSQRFEVGQSSVGNLGGVKGKHAEIS